MVSKTRMLKTVILMLVIMNLGWISPAYARVQTKKDTYINRISDWFATVGKSQDEKYIIKNKRRRDRKIKKAKKRIRRKKKEYFKNR